MQRNHYPSHEEKYRKSILELYLEIETILGYRMIDFVILGAKYSKFKHMCSHFHIYAQDTSNERRLGNLLEDKMEKFKQNTRFEEGVKMFQIAESASAEREEDILLKKEHRDRCCIPMRRDPNKVCLEILDTIQSSILELKAWSQETELDALWKDNMFKHLRTLMSDWRDVLSGED